MLTSADGCWRMLTYAPVMLLLLLLQQQHADVCIHAQPAC